MTKLQMRKPIIEGTPIPKGYAQGYFDPFGMIVYAYPIPIALAVRLWTKIRQRLLYIQPTWMDETLASSYEAGYRACQRDIRRKSEKIMYVLSGNSRLGGLDD